MRDGQTYYNEWSADQETYHTMMSLLEAEAVARKELDDALMQAKSVGVAGFVVSENRRIDEARKAYSVASEQAEGIRWSPLVGGWCWT